MTNSVCFVPSSNGYGHLRRVSSIARALKENHQVQTSLIWNRHKTFPQVVDLNNSFDKILEAETPLLFDGPPASHPVKSNISHIKLGELLSNYEVVLSDTLTWPLLVREDAVFLGQFTWEFYHQRLGHKRKFSPDEALRLAWMHNPAYCMGEFVWDEMSIFKNLQRLPVFDYWNLRDAALSEAEEILVSFSGTKSALEQSQTFHGLDFYPKVVRGLENYLRENMEKPLAIICRPGLGIVSECISAKVIPIIVEDDDPEMSFNRKVLVEDLGIGLGYEEIQNRSKSEALELLMNFRSSIIWPEVITSKEFAEKYIVEERFGTGGQGH